MIQVATLNWRDVDKHALAALIIKIRGDILTPPGISKNTLARQLDAYHQPVGVVVARSGNDLIGFLLLYSIYNTSILVANPECLGGHPIVTPHKDSKRVTQLVCLEATNWAGRHGYQSIFIEIPWSYEATSETNEENIDLYQSIGFRLIQTARRLVYDLHEKGVPLITSPNNVEVTHVMVVDEADLYRCFQDTFKNYQLPYISSLRDNERREVFDRLYSYPGISSPASLAFLSDDRIAGFSFCYSGDGGGVLDLMCIHPDFQRQGLGQFMLSQCMYHIAQAGDNKLALICELKNSSALNFFIKFGFYDQGGLITFEWRDQAGGILPIKL
jgi:ribosomal protein S18 acetylase RimI-like enzyme